MKTKSTLTRQNGKNPLPLPTREKNLNVSGNWSKLKLGPVLFLLLAIGSWLGMQGSTQLATLSITFISILLEAMPFMLLGALISGCLEVFVPQERLAKWLPTKGWKSLLIGAGLGIVLPICECASVPIVRRLLKKGMPLGAGIAFLLAGPIVNPLVAISTAVAYRGNWSMMGMRLFCGYLIAVLVGGIMQFLYARGPGIVNTALATPQCSAGEYSGDGVVRHLLQYKLQHAFRHAAADFLDIGRYFIIGAFLAALFQTFIARQLLDGSSNPMVIILAMMALAVVLNLCSEADAFVAASFQSSGIPFYGQLAFLVLGPMLDLKLLVMYLGFFRRRVVVVFVTVIVVVVFTSMLMLELLIR